MKLIRTAMLFVGSIAVLVLCGCSSYSTERRGLVGGMTVTPERLAQISAEVFAWTEGAMAGSTEEATRAPFILTPETPLYWTPNGSAYHGDRDCQYLRNSKEIKSGRIDEAVGAGKKKPCSACAGG